MKHVGRFFSVYLDGNRKLAETAAVEEPDLKWIRETKAGGGAIGETSVAMIMEEMRGSITFYNYDPDAIRLYGVTPGNPLPFQLRRSLYDTRSQEKGGVVMHWKGSIDLEFPDWDRKRLEGVKIPIFLTAYRRWLDGVEQFHIEPEEGIFDVDGVSVFGEEMTIIGAR